VLIAIPSDTTDGLEAAISEHFGHCAAFTLVAVTDGTIGDVSILQNTGHQEGGCMAPVNLLKDNGVDVLIAGGMGMRPLSGFQQVGIDVHHKEDATSVQEAVTLFLKGGCRAFGEAQTCGGGEGGCGGHDHDHDGFCDHDPDCDGYEDDGDESDNQVSLIRAVGSAAEARAQLGAAVKVYQGESGTSDLALIFLGKNYHMLRTNVIGDALFVDMKDKVNDWVFDDFGVGHYEQGGSSHDGNINLVQSVVADNVYKYRDDRGEYQDLGEEHVIVDNAVAPPYDLSGFIVPGPNKTIYNGVTSLNGVHTEDTVVFIMDPGDKLTLTGCNFRGGMVVYVPPSYNLRDGYRNRVYLKGGTSIGGGSNGCESNLGLLAPAVKLTSGPNSGYGMSGFTYVNEIGAMKDTFFHGQLVILNQVANLKDSVIIFDENVAMAPPQSVGFGNSIGSTDIISLFEDFD